MSEPADAFLPTVNAGLNALATVLLVRGRRLARAGAVEAHRRTMLAAFAVSTLFLACYVAHKAARQFENTTFHAEGALKIFYLALLASHVVLAMAVPVLAIVLIRYGLRGRVQSHRRVARVAWPIWMYVSVTGVVIYVMLYHLNPAPRVEAAPPADVSLDRPRPSGLPTRPTESLESARPYVVSTAASQAAARSGSGTVAQPGARVLARPASPAPAAGTSGSGLRSGDGEPGRGESGVRNPA